jgi:methylated-DNA-protein-cysteine methyltransferase-like protein
MGKRAKNLYEVVYEMVKKIPKGKVATYGQIARLCGLCEHARLVGYALYNLKPGSSVPWHRVVNSKGMISLPEHTGAYEQQKSLLQREGVLFKDEKIDLAKHGFGYSPEGPLRERRRKQQRGPEEARPR